MGVAVRSVKEEATRRWIHVKLDFTSYSGVLVVEAFIHNMILSKDRFTLLL